MQPKKQSNEVLRLEVKREFWKENKRWLKDIFERASNPNEFKISSEIVFTSREEIDLPPFRWKDDFQLGQVPDGNPKCEGWGVKYPCLFQYKVPVTGISFLDNHRAFKVYKSLFLPLIPILEQCCNVSIECDLERSVRQEWALCEKAGVYENELAYESKWLNLEYQLETDISQNSWYQYDNIDVVELPNIERLFNWLDASDISFYYLAYEALSANDKEMFLLGCEWFNKSIKARNPTDQLLFMMIMLEIFLPKDKSPCDECGQDINSINRKFKTYIPQVIGANWTPDFEKILGYLYSLRSKIAHDGVAIAQHSIGLNPEACKEESHLRYLLHLGRQFLISWLVKQGRMQNS